MWYSNLKKHLFLDISSTNIGTLVPSLYQCVETRSTEVFLAIVQPFLHLPFNLSSLPKRLTPVVNHFTRQTLPIANRKQTHKKEHNRTLLFGSTQIKHGRHFNNWNQPLNMRVRVCYLHCHEAGLCCYIVIHIENLLCPLLLLYLHLWPIYWLSLVLLKEIIHFSCPVHCGTYPLCNLVLVMTLQRALSVTKTKLRGFSPQANYTDRASDRSLSAKLVPTLADRERCNTTTKSDAS
jgi:hypothetical protein